MKWTEYTTEQLQCMLVGIRGDMRRSDNLNNAVVSHDLRCALDQCTAELESRNETIPD